MYIVADGVTDTTEAFQAAVTLAASGGTSILELPPGICRLTAPIQVKGKLLLQGEGAEADYAKPFSVGGGSWLLFDHPGKGLCLDLANPAGNTQVSFKGFGTFRKQPAPATNWAPGAFDWDIYSNPSSIASGGGIRLDIEDLMLLNPTKAIYGEQTICTVQKLRGQPLDQGFLLDKAYDVCRLNGIHWWPYWSQDPSIYTYTQNHLMGIQLKRVDNPIINDYFGYAMAYTIRFSRGSDGCPAMVMLSNFGSDFSSNGMVFDPDVSGTEVRVSNGYTWGRAAAGQGSGIQILGSNCHLGVSNFKVAEMHDWGIVILGSGNIFKGFNYKVVDWDIGGSGFMSALYVGAGNKAYLATPIDAYPGPLTRAPVTGGAGLIQGA